MRGTNSIVYKIFTCFIICVLLVGYLPAPANAGTIIVDHTALHTPASWPTSFVAYTDENGNIITDQNGEINPTYADIRSGSTISGTNPPHGLQSSVYMLSDGTNMFFRMRIGGNPINNSKFRNTNYMISIGTLTITNNHWKSALVIGLNGNANGSYVYLTKDGNTVTKVYNVKATGTNQGAAVVPISDGTGQYFLDFQVPVSELKAFTDTNGNQFQDTTPIRLFYATSQANNLAVINKDYVGTSDFSGGTTTPAAPAVPTGLVASEITQTSSTLTWTPSSRATSYHVFQDSVLVASPTTNTVPITGLTANTTYAFKVSALNEIGESPKSTPASVTTLPNAPTGLVASAITQTSATLTWDTTSGAAFYKVFKDGTLYASPTANTAPVTDLTASTTYSFTVSAVNASGEGAQSTALPVMTLPAAPVAPTLKVLEVQPGTTYDLTTSMLSELFANSAVLTQMSMPEFISKVDEINGKYDVVYIGNNISGGIHYSSLGDSVTTLPQGGSSSKEYYSGNDITNRRANTLKDFINSKQLTIFDQSILGSDSTFRDAKLYQNFNTYLNNNTYPNFISVDTSSSKNAHIQAAFLVYNASNVAKRPVLKLNSQPVLYDGTDASYQTDKSLGFNFDISNQSNAYNMSYKLYIDVNGDGIFKATDNYAGKPEVVYEKNNVNSYTGYTINFHLPDSYVGLEPWKMELTDNATGAKAYQTGATAFKVTNSSNELRARVLQLLPSGNTLSIYSLGQNLLVKDMVYRIDVTEMNVADFNAAYAGLQSNETPLPKPATVNGISSTAPTVLNGNYDMVIMGFADIYGGNDLTNTNAINALKSFINTNQSVMFTHDTLTFDVDGSGAWGYNITENFRNIVGQQRYYRTPPDSTRYYDPMPYLQKDSYGFSNLTLGRYNGSKLFQTTTKTYKVNDNLITQFPFVLEDIPVAATHFQYFQLDLEDENVVPVYNLTNNSNSTIFNHPGDGRNDYYTYSKGSITYSGTGHSAPNGLPEKQMFINTIIKASRGANHAPTLDIYGISEGMGIANSLTSIDFSFKATDIDPNEPYLNADIYLSTSADGTNFSPYENIRHFSATDPDLSRRVTSGVAQTISVPKAVDSNIEAYKVKVEAYDSYGASDSREIKLNNKLDPQITVDSYSTSCLIGDTITIPVNVSAQATELTETFKNISSQGSLTSPSGVETQLAIAQKSYPDVIFSPAASWNTQSQSYEVTFGDEGKYTLLNRLTYTAYNGVPPLPSDITGQTRGNDQTFSIQVGSGKLDVEVLDQKDNGITGIPITVSGPHTGTTNHSGLFSLTGLSSGEYTVTVTVPEGRSIGSTSQTVTLSADTPYQKIIFSMGGNLIINPSIKSRSGDTQLSTIKNAPIQTNIGFNLTRPATSLNVDLNSSLDGSSTNVAISKVYCNSQEISFSTIGGKLIPSQSTSFPSGTYTIEATVTIVGGTMQVGQSFDISLTQQTSAQDENTGSIEPIASPSSLIVNVVSLISNPKITTHSGAFQMSILKNVPLQVIAGFDLALPATFLKIDMRNSYGSTMNVAISKVYCNDREIGFSVSGGKLLPSQTTSFPSGTYKLNAIVTLNGGIMQEDQIFTLELTNLTAAQEEITGNVENINSVSLSLKVKVGSSPNLH